MQTQTLVTGTGISSEVYYSEEIYRTELRNIFGQVWCYVGHSTELDDENTVKLTTLGAVPVAMFRRGSVIHVARVPGLLRTDLPQFVTAADLPPTSQMTLLDSDDRAGFVFASLVSPEQSLDEHLAGAGPYLDAFVSDPSGLSLATASRSHRLEYAGNWKLQLENAVDSYHANFVHRSFFTILNDRTGSDPHYISGKGSGVSRSLGNGHTMLDQRAALGDRMIERIKALPDASGMVSDLQAAVGEQQMRAMCAGVPGPGFNLAIFPNLVLVGIHIREIIPVAVNHTRVILRPLIARDGPSVLNHLRLRYHEMFFGPAGFGQPDDLEMFDRVGAATRSSPGWLILERGAGREEHENGVVVGHLADELTQRAQYHQWSSLMARQP